jgi:hypothetical protein
VAIVFWPLIKPICSKGGPTSKFPSRLPSQF